MFAIAAALMVGCNGEAPSEESKVIEPDVRSYVVRGVVHGLPNPDQPGSTLMVEHEAIPEFVRQDGSLGMGAMTMPFGDASKVDLSGVSVGDKLSITFTVAWDPPAMEVVAVEKLPVETELVLTTGSPDQARPGHHQHHGHDHGHHDH